ncbi:MAG: DUF342 domain-containing protein [Candidatus Omnitrophica bacterium]|nr:DUF342 domain-containing protein [Candidatus Omnitrophota bacterium]MCA9415581.1 DUF342 domain-containing protein [Candidatus Omnitrophota bacterium]MCA9430213.1 DUF342 domain-containing protein [Candidatus Omnitrophota bacterium]MCA9440592.1 DUF342 domain-containing protein [Candidatus Omnitrophota bacterium]MCB9767323.1 DUF342 domain-containing protein [Candidatus Omnitrophota bacterium]
MNDSIDNLDWKVSDDRLSVLVRFEKPVEDPISPEDFNLVLLNNGIQSPCNPELFLQAQTEGKAEWVAVATGSPATEPVDARLEYFVHPAMANRKVSNDQEPIDFKNLGRILNVEKGRELVRKHDPIPGAPGVDVYGQPIEPREPKNVSIPVGQGVEILEDGHLAVADEDGAISAAGQRISVIQIYPVSGNISYRTGNIHFKGTVDIGGDVQSGFEVHAEGDILVKGLVEAATLEAGGDIFVMGGFQGGSKGSLKAGGSIQVRFANEGTLEAAGDIEAEVHLLNCQVRAGGEISLKGAKGVIAGGDNRAGKKISAGILGTEIGVKTILQIGLSDDIFAEIKATEKQIEETTEKLAQIAEILMKLEKVKSDQGSLSQEHEEIRIRTVREQFAIMGELGKQNKTLVQQKEEQEMARKGRIAAGQTVFPGVVVKFPGDAFTVKNEMKYTTFYFERGEVRTRAS